MPFGKWENFEDCVRDFVSKGKDEESAKKICGALQARLGKEGFSWTGSIKQIPGAPNLIRGQALHPIKTYHHDEWPDVRVYLEEELKRSAQSLAGKPLLLDHYRPLRGEVLGAEYEDGAIEYIAKLDDQEVLNKIRDGRIKHCSVEFEWKSLENVDGVAPRGINFVGLSLLENLLPGDFGSSVQIWESILKRLKEAKGLTPPNPGIISENSLKGSETEAKTKMSRNPIWERVWDRKFINDLPDNAFAIILPGGEKDEQGKTVPRNLRKFPHHRADGSLDLPHLRNANSRCPQSDLSAEQKAEAQAHLDKHKKAAGIGEVGQEAKEPFKHKWTEQGEEIEFQVAPEPTMDELIESIEDIVEQINARLEALEQAQKPAEPIKEKQATAAKELQPPSQSVKPSLAEAVIPPSTPLASDLIGRAGVVKKIEAIIPEDFVIRQHGVGGFTKLVQDLKRLKREIEIERPSWSQDVTG